MLLKKVTTVLKKRSMVTYRLQKTRPFNNQPTRSKLALMLKRTLKSKSKMSLIVTLSLRHSQRMKKWRQSLKQKLMSCSKRVVSKVSK